MPTIKPFQNEADSIMIGDLTVENRLDRIEIYGSAQITRDKAGLKLAKELKKLVDATVTALQAEELPEQVPVKPAENVDNPFK
ncbi:MAG: hypothetical protein V4632_02445 [Pseudomonadota bacterium]